MNEKYQFKKITIFMAPFYQWGLTASKLQSHYEEAVYFLPQSSQKFLVLIWSTSEGWKAELTLEPPSGFDHGPLDWEFSNLTNRPLLHSVLFFWFFMQWKKEHTSYQKNQSMQIINWQNNPPSRQIYVQWCYKIEAYI